MQIEREEEEEAAEEETEVRRLFMKMTVTDQGKIHLKT